MLGVLIKRERTAQNMSQQALCHGICAVSYLSKIENGQAECSREMYALLFAALNIEYVSNEALLTEFDETYSEYMRLLRSALRIPYSFTQKAAALCERVKYSPAGVKAALLAALCREVISAEEISLLAFFKPFLSGELKMLFHYANALHFLQTETPAKAAAEMENAKNPDEPWTYNFLGVCYLYIGSYNLGISCSEESYRIFASRGCVSGMLYSAIDCAAAYSNMQNIAKMLRWNNIAKNINSIAKSREDEGLIAYNTGATLLMYGHSSAALPHLLLATKCLEENSTRYNTADDATYTDYTYQKLAFAYAFIGDAENAKKYCAEIKNISNNSLIERSITLIHYIAENPGYIKSKEYCELLEACFSSAQKELIRGRMEFFGRFLLEAYKGTRQYKKAVLFAEKYNISFDFPQIHEFS